MPSHAAAVRHLGLLFDTMMGRRLEPHMASVGKRLMKSPEIFLRDSGLLHALLGSVLEELSTSLAPALALRPKER